MILGNIDYAQEQLQPDILDNARSENRGMAESFQNDEMLHVKQQSLALAEESGQIGLRRVFGFELFDVRDEGNCFYEAIADQMQHVIRHPFICTIPHSTAIHDSLRLRIQRNDFRDREWAEDQTIDQFVREFPDIILSIIDTGNPEVGFVSYYLHDSVVITNIGTEDLPDRPIIRIAATGNHYLSVRSHPRLNMGSVHEPLASLTLYTPYRRMQSEQSSPISNSNFVRRHSWPGSNPRF